MKLLLKLFISLLASLIGVIILYIVVALLLSCIPANRNATQATEGVEIYITTNGVHADFTVPVITPTIDWRNHLPLRDYPGANSGFQYVAFGWGDKGFYLHTPQWSDLTLSTAANAILWPSPTAMHVTYYRRPPVPGNNSRRLVLSPEQYQQLARYIQESFERTEDGRFILIKNAGYSAFDNFYEARGSYSFLYTCNNWVNEGLKEVGVKTSLWTPFDKGIMYHLDQE
ncbi:TIGR02117 family protein [Cesiribacter sp. SM1]|uniref:TIGR02117 family protein n=1 Tax=Cesiribacter sp. SM1 TaxID=2861196 RepID=UPI001CD701E9|nr:TIGR02117 family protein [Cesiribacter sp. SM1]